MSVDQETLMAYVDGELDAVEAARVRKQLACEPELRARVQIFEESARTVHTALRNELDAPVPAHLQALLQPAAPRHQPAPRPDTMSLLASWLKSLWAQPAYLAFAASLLLGVGVAGGMLANKVLNEVSIAERDGFLAAEGSAAWNRGFDQTPSGESFPLVTAPDRPSQRITPTATFVDVQERYCRAFQTMGAESAHRHGVVCRDGDGGWPTVVMVAETQAPHGHDTRGDYRPASGNAEDDVGRIIESRMATSPFDEGEEKTLIDRGWTKTP